MRIVSIMLFLAVLPLGSGYYDLLRIVVSIAAAVNIYRGSYIFIPILILFNPIIPVYLYDKSVWAIIDICSGLVFWNLSEND
mgnify:FL=1|tara:strand:+ start:1632 stop:1877 length:246 start_codon:yes stop_codon:yes gene_type:complete